MAGAGPRAGGPAGHAGVGDRWYALLVTRGRDRETILDFAREYAGCRGTQPAIRSIEGSDVAGSPIPAQSFERLVDVGLRQAAGTFLIARLEPRLAEHRAVALAFSADGGLMLGLEVDEPEDAAWWIEHLADRFRARVAFVSDGPLPRTAADAIEMISDRRLIYLSWDDMGGKERIA